MNSGKAARLDGLSVKHLINSHPILECVLARLFNQILRIGYVPTQFGYTVTKIKLRVIKQS